VIASFTIRYPLIAICHGRGLPEPPVQVKAAAPMWKALRIRLLGGAGAGWLRRAVGWVAVFVLGASVVILVAGLAYRFVPPVSTLMLARWATLRPVDRITVPLDAIAPSLAAAVIASEDGRFCSHRGVDWGALREVIGDAEDDAPSRGASTIAMQTAKNLFLWPGRSYIRKALELPIALYVDLVLGKRRVMEVYLNMAEWGDGIFGAEAAARRHFGKSARNLTAAEAALLAAALPNPRLRNAGRPSARHRALAGRLLARMERHPPARACLQPSRSASTGPWAKD
jgi:monofunctional biosynthetic peptidoglycan transglycosylase